MTNSAKQFPKPRLLSILLGLLGLGLLIPGVQLASLGGSWYYGSAGLVLLVCAVLLFRGQRAAAALYGVFLVATVVWAWLETGADAWALLPRLGFFLAIGLLFCLPRVRRGLWQSQPPALLGQWPAWAGLALGAGLVVALFTGGASDPVQPATALGSGVANADTDWSAYGATRAGTRHAPHGQIDAANVATLERAWVARTGVPGTFKGTPVQIGSGLYLCTGQNVMLSLDPDTGAERWRFDPQINTPPFGFWDTCRGVTHYRLPTADAAAPLCAERLFTATTDARLFAVDAATGQRCPDFGNNGEISLLPGMGEVKPGFYFVTSPPTIARDTLVLGGWVADNQETEEPSGVVRGFDPVTGALRWAWDMGREDRHSLPPEGESYTRGTPNVWSLTSADDELGLIYVPTGNATPDYFGGHRGEAMEKYASSVVALDADSGRVRWHYQTTHHDIWDYDVPSQPTLVDVPIDGAMRKAVIVPTKRAQIFLLDRETGEPLTQVQERATPQTNVAEEYTVPTQPFSTGMPSFDHPRLRESDMWGITPFDQLACRLSFRKLRYEGPLTPPSTQGTLYYPGIAGGMNWGSVAVDPVNALMVVNTLHMPFVVRLIPRDEVVEGMQFGLGGQQRGTPYAVYSMPFLSPLFAPCLRPPYGEMAVVDLANQSVLWRRPLGTAAEQGPLGIKSRLPLPMGMFYQAGSMVTGGGLIFMGGVGDRTMRALDLYTGEQLWTDPLPASSQATPMSYVSPATGQQYVIVTVPDGDRTPLSENAARESLDGAAAAGGYVIAYRLPPG
ncbi:MAG: membrane-bound PQQ-dependent dehydrogenase, glucose/quinate/shikimate family [Pseudomonadales bacterium]